MPVLSCFITVEHGNPFNQRCIFYSHTQAETICIWNIHWITSSVYTVEDNSSTIQLVVLFVSTYYLNVLVYMFFEQHSESLILWMQSITATWNMLRGIGMICDGVLIVSNGDSFIIDKQGCQSASNQHLGMLLSWGIIETSHRYYEL